MKWLAAIYVFLMFLLTACQKDQHLKSLSGDNLFSASSLKDGQGGGGGGGGGNTSSDFLQSVLSGTASRLIAGDSDSIWVSFTQAAPAGWILKLSSGDASVQVPANYPVPQGAFNVHPPVISSVVTAARFATISVALGSQTKTTTLKVFPRTFNFPAPNLQTPGNGAGFKNRIQVKFTWSDNVNAYYHDIQISDNAAFNNVPMLEVYLNDPIWAASYFNGLGNRYWRVRYVDASGNFGPWSAVNRFEIKQ